MNILLLEDGELELPASDRRVRHVRKVLKLGPGDTLRAGIVDGPHGIARIEALDSSRMRVTFSPDPTSDESSPRRSSESGGRLELLLGHPRPIVLRRMLRDLCTIGVDRIVVVPTALGEKSYYRARMWRDIRPYLLEGAEQAGFTRLPEVLRAPSLRDGLGLLHDRNGSNCLRAVLHTGIETPLASLFRGITPRADDSASARPAPAQVVTLAIGSERGWTELELDELRHHGFVPGGLGERTLRTETAALVACWLARSSL